MACSIDWDVVCSFSNGSSCLHRWWVGGLLLTDGVHYLAQNGAGWLVDLIALQRQLSPVRGEPFQVWTLHLQPDGGCVVQCKPDKDAPVLAQQAIAYTDFPHDITLWCVDDTLLLPAEY